MMPNRLFGEDTMNAPWGLPARLKLVLMACRFFGAARLADSYRLIGKEVPKGGNPEPLTAGDFLKWLETGNAFLKPPNGLRVMQLIDRMVSSGLLVRAGYGNRSFAGMGDHYLHMATKWDERRKHFRYASVLGPEFLYHLCAQGLVHITGTSGETRDVAAGTGLVIDSCHVLTCRHVVTDMVVDRRQIIQGQEYVVDDGSVFPHPACDVAVIRVDGPPMSPLQGAIFQRPVVGQTVHTLGYPEATRPEGGCGHDPAGSGDERVSYFVVGGTLVPLLGDFKTGKQRWAGRVRRWLHRRHLHRRCDRRVPSG